MALREAEREYYNQEICENKNNCGAIWKTIRSALPNKTGRASFTKDTDTLANEFNHFFISLGEKAARDLSFTSSSFPRAWKKSVLVLHLKDGDHEMPNNNCPIPLLPVLSKLTEKIALN